jgi:hypothetical protein
VAVVAEQDLTQVIEVKNRFFQDVLSWVLSSFRKPWWWW